MKGIADLLFEAKTAFVMARLRTETGKKLAANIVATKWYDWRMNHYSE